MDIMDIQAVESKLSDVTVTPIPRSQVQNFYNYQQQREQREQLPQIQISAIHHPPRDRNKEYHQNSSSSVTALTSASTAASVAAAALQYTQLQAQLALLQQQANTIASPASGRATSSSSLSISASNSNGNGASTSTQSQLKYPQSTSPIIVTQTSANITTPLTSTANLPTVGSNTVNNGLTKYAQLLAVIEEMGRDIRPTYTGSRSSTERLKRGIVHARILVRECLMETERSARQ